MVTKFGELKPINFWNLFTYLKTKEKIQSNLWYKFSVANGVSGQIELEGQNQALPDIYPCEKD